MNVTSKKIPAATTETIIVVVVSCDPATFLEDVDRDVGTNCSDGNIDGCAEGGGADITSAEVGNTDGKADGAVGYTDGEAEQGTLLHGQKRYESDHVVAEQILDEVNGTEEK